MFSTDRSIRKTLGILAAVAAGMFVAHFGLQRYTMACQDQSEALAQPAHVFVGTDWAGLAAAELYSSSYSQGLETALAAEIMGISQPLHSLLAGRSEIQPEVARAFANARSKQSAADSTQQLESSRQEPAKTPVAPTILIPLSSMDTTEPSHQTTVLEITSTAKPPHVIRPSVQLWVAEHGFNMFINGGVSIMLGQAGDTQDSNQAHWINVTIQYVW